MRRRSIKCFRRRRTGSTSAESAEDRERTELMRRRRPRHLEAGDLGGRLRRLVPRDRVLDRLAFPLEDGLDAPVLAVPDPARESDSEGVPATVGAEVDALDDAAKSHAGPGAHDPFNERRA